MSVFDQPPQFEKDTSVGMEGNFRRLQIGAGSTIAKFDKTGFFIGGTDFDSAPFKVDYLGNLTTGGTIQGATIKNGAGDVVIDSTGLNSAANFRADKISSAVQQTTSSDSFVDVPGSTMDSFTLVRDTVVVLSFSGFAYNDRYAATAGQDSSVMILQLVDSVDGIVGVLVLGGKNYTLLDEFFFPTDAVTDPEYGTDVTTALLSAGTHTLKLQFKRESVGTAVLDGFGVTYSILGV